MWSRPTGNTLNVSSSDRPAYPPSSPFSTVNPFSSQRLPWRVYPFGNLLRWLTASRYRHLIQAYERRADRFQDTLVQSRIDTMRRWDRIRAFASFLLYLSLAATIAAWIARFLPRLADATELFGRLAALASTFTGIITLVFLFLTRLLGQLEMDILTMLIIDHKNRKPNKNSK